MSLKSRIENYKPGQNFQATELQKLESCSDEELKQEIFLAINQEILTPVYRLFTTQKVNGLSDNNWTKELSKFAKKFTLEDGTIFDGMNPKNIEIAFLRL